MLILWGAPAAACGNAVIGGSGEWPPISFRDRDGALTGFAVEVARAGLQGVASVTMAPPLPWKRLLRDSAQSGEIAVIAGAYHTPERERSFVYAENPVWVEDLRAFLPKRRPLRVAAREDLIGYQGVRPLDGSYGAEFDAFMAQNLNVEEIANRSRMFDMLTTDAVDYILLSETDGKVLIGELGLEDSIIMSDAVLAEIETFILFSRKSPCSELVELFNKNAADFLNSPQGILAKKRFAYVESAD